MKACYPQCGPQTSSVGVATWTPLGVLSPRRPQDLLDGLCVDRVLGNCGRREVRDTLPSGGFEHLWSGREMLVAPGLPRETGRPVSSPSLADCLPLGLQLTAGSSSAPPRPGEILTCSPCTSHRMLLDHGHVQVPGDRQQCSRSRGGGPPKPAHVPRPALSTAPLWTHGIPHPP